MNPNPLSLTSRLIVPFMLGIFVLPLCAVPTASGPRMFGLGRRRRCGSTQPAEHRLNAFATQHLALPVLLKSCSVAVSSRHDGLPLYTGFVGRLRAGTGRNRHTGQPDCEPELMVVWMSIGLARVESSGAGCAPRPRPNVLSP